MCAFRCPCVLCIEFVARHLCAQQDRVARSPSAAREQEVPLNIMVDPRARPAVGGGANGDAATSSGVGLTKHAVAAVVRRPPQVVICVRQLPSSRPRS